MEAKLHTALTLAVDGGDRSASPFSHFMTSENLRCSIGFHRVYFLVMVYLTTLSVSRPM